MTVLTPVADLGGHPARAPPTAQNFLNFMQFFAKFGKITCWRPPGGLAPPPMGNPGSAPEHFCFIPRAVFVSDCVCECVLVCVNLVCFLFNRNVTWVFEQCQKSLIIEKCMKL